MNMDQEDRKKKLIRNRVDNSVYLKTLGDNSLMHTSTLGRSSIVKKKKNSLNTPVLK